MLWGKLKDELCCLTQCCACAGLLSLDPTGDPTALLASLTMGTEVEVQFGKSLTVSVLNASIL